MEYFCSALFSLSPTGTIVLYLLRFYSPWFGSHSRYEILVHNIGIFDLRDVYIVC
jgi:hypothetical protein